MQSTKKWLLGGVVLVLGGILSLGADDVNTKIAKEMKKTMYQDKPCTVRYAKNNHSTVALNCVQYSYRIKDIAQKSGVRTEIWQAGGAHSIVIVIQGNKRTCYSNGKVVREEAYEKIKRLE